MRQVIMRTWLTTIILVLLDLGQCAVYSSVFNMEGRMNATELIPGTQYGNLTMHFPLTSWLGMTNHASINGMEVTLIDSTTDFQVTFTFLSQRKTGKTKMALSVPEGNGTFNAVCDYVYSGHTNLQCEGVWERILEKTNLIFSSYPHDYPQGIRMSYDIYIETNAGLVKQFNFSRTGPKFHFDKFKQTFYFGEDTCFQLQRRSTFKKPYLLIDTPYEYRMQKVKNYTIGTTTTIGEMGCEKKPNPTISFTPPDAGLLWGKIL